MGGLAFPNIRLSFFDTFSTIIEKIFPENLQATQIFLVLVTIDWVSLNVKRDSFEGCALGVWGRRPLNAARKASIFRAVFVVATGNKPFDQNGQK